jgi:hypothetical protein
MARRVKNYARPKSAINHGPLASAEFLAMIAAAAGAKASGIALVTVGTAMAMRMKLSVALAAVTNIFVASGAARAADVKINDIKAYFYLERTGRLSDNFLGAKEAFHNVSTGGSAAEPASNILVEVVIGGEKNTAPKFASTLVNITQFGKNGQKTRTTKGFGGFVFGDSGETHKSLFLENATCLPIEIEVKAGKSTKTVRAEFSCDEPKEEVGPGVGAVAPKKK